MVLMVAWTRTAVSSKLPPSKQESCAQNARDRVDPYHRFPIVMSKRCRDRTDSLLVSVVMAPVRGISAAPAHTSLPKTSPALNSPAPHGNPERMRTSMPSHKRKSIFINGVGAFEDHRQSRWVGRHLYLPPGVRPKSNHDPELELQLRCAKASTSSWRTVLNFLL
jgi:hypothetical protein